MEPTRLVPVGAPTEKIVRAPKGSNHIAAKEPDGGGPDHLPGMLILDGMENDSPAPPTPFPEPAAGKAKVTVFMPERGGGQYNLMFLILNPSYRRTPEVVEVGKKNMSYRSWAVIGKAVEVETFTQRIVRVIR